MSTLSRTLPVLALALVMPAGLQAQNYADLPPLTPMDEADLRDLPEEYRTAPLTVQGDETVTQVNGVETITRTRRIEGPRPRPAAPAQPHQGYSYPAGYAPTYASAPVVFEREDWLRECRRRTRDLGRDDTGVIIGGLLGAIAGGFAGYEIAGVGDRVLGTALGVGGGGLIGGLIGSLFDGDDDEDRYDCDAALDSYLSTYGTPGARVASREIAYAPPAYAAPAYGYGYGYPAYTYAAPPQMVMVPVRTETQQQVVVRETERYETYAVPGASREIPAQRPSAKMIKNR
ncbi:hypothetical protein [Erythrobacter sp. R86502]|uniref:hypothetical protein n=1 Tax=Erythrobacter sp. R86502 TaxID=3093846 RepID=UPI0036D3663E